MLLKLILLFILLPLIELKLLLIIKDAIDWPATIALVLATGVLGGAMARREGLRTWAKIQRDLAAGRLPTDSMIDGLIILIGGAVLIAPGILTDLLGLATLFPFSRAWIAARLKRRFKSSFKITTSFPPPFQDPGSKSVKDTDDWNDLS